MRGHVERRSGDDQMMADESEKIERYLYRIVKKQTHKKTCVRTWCKPVVYEIKPVVP